jgi:hypothetical protein
MVLSDIQRAFKESACGEIEVAASGLGRFIVHVPFTFDDGDHFVVLLLILEQTSKPTPLA